MLWQSPMNKITVIIVIYLVIGCASKQKGVLFITGSYPEPPGWTKKRAIEYRDFMCFTGISKLNWSIEQARDGAIYDAVGVFLNYAEIKDKRVLEMFRQDLAPKIIDSDKRNEKGPYEITVSDFYWEKYAIKKTKKICYKGYAHLRWPIFKWIEFRRYVRESIEQKFEKRYR